MESLGNRAVIRGQRLSHRTPFAGVVPGGECNRLRACTVERLGGFLWVSLHFVLPPQKREMRELDGQQYLRGAVSMSARASLVRACTSSSGAA